MRKTRFIGVVSLADCPNGAKHRFLRIRGEPFLKHPYDRIPELCKGVIRLGESLQVVPDLAFAVAFYHKPLLARLAVIGKRSIGEAISGGFIDRVNDPRGVEGIKTKMMDKDRNGLACFDRRR